MTTAYVVRQAGAEHVAKLAAVERAAATRFGDSLPESVLSHVTPQDSLAAAQRTGLLWVALEPQGAAVGFAVASVNGRRAHLEELDVLPEYGRQGIGSALVEAVADHARRSGCSEVTLTTFRDVPWNAPFYAGIGFESIPEPELDADLARRLSDEAALGLERSRRIAMRKPLGSPLDHPTDSAELHWAAESGDVASVEELIARGYPVDSFDDLGRTPLHYAALRGHLDAVSALLRAGADVNARDVARLSNTPLGEVASTCSLEMAELLVEAGADPTIPGWMQLTAVDKACRRTRGEGPAVCEYLRGVAQGHLAATAITPLKPTSESDGIG